jgi:hypothetical protein
MIDRQIVALLEGNAIEPGGLEEQAVLQHMV